MKQYEITINRTSLSYFHAYKLAKEGYCISRREWDGFHFILNDKYYILLETGEILENPKEKYDTDKNDWIIVNPTPEALKILSTLF